MPRFLRQLICLTGFSVVGLSIAGCERTPVEPTPFGAVGAIPGSSGAPGSIEALVDAYREAWAAKDAAAYSAIYAEEARFVNPLGAVLVGRAAIRAQHAFLFAGPFAPTTSELTIASVQYLTGTIAVVSVDVSLTGFAVLPPGLVATEPGVLRTRMLWVVQKRAGTWEIITQQLTAVAPAPPTS